MRKTLLILALVLLSYGTFSQNNEAQLTDTVKYLNQKISELEYEGYTVESYRLNFDDCNIECKFNSIEGDQWRIIEFWLLDIDESRLRWEAKDDKWVLRIFSKDDAKSFQMDKTDGYEEVSELTFESDNKEKILEIGRVLFYAIKQCKGLDRFKNR